jgi:hypothetical protein
VLSTLRMKNIIALIALLWLSLPTLFAQTDSSVVYLNKDDAETIKETAYKKGVFTKKDDLWHGKVVYVKNGQLQSEGDYHENNFTKPEGNFTNYNEDGTVYWTASYANGIATERTYYYKKGNRKSWIKYGEKTEQKAWDESGKELRNYVVEKEAHFKGGAEGWGKYLQKHLNGDVAAQSGAPAGQYQVKVQFIVSKEGVVSNVKAVEIPKLCKACGAEAVNVILASPEWEPAVQNNEPTKFQAIQYVTFVVEESRKAKRG